MNLTYQVDLLHDKIGTTLAMNSRQSLITALLQKYGELLLKHIMMLDNCH